MAKFPPNVMTPNGPAFAIAETKVGDEWGHILCRHPKGKDIDVSLCSDTRSKTGQPNGWLVTYPREKVSEI